MKSFSFPQVDDYINTGPGHKLNDSNKHLQQLIDRSFEELRKLGLSIMQIKILKATSPAEIYTIAFAPIEKDLIDGIKEALPPAGFTKKHTIIPMIYDYKTIKSSASLKWYSKWIEKVLINYGAPLHWRLLMQTYELISEWSDTSFVSKSWQMLSEGVKDKMMEKIKTLNDFAPPCILEYGNSSKNNGNEDSAFFCSTSGTTEPDIIISIGTIV